MNCGCDLNHIQNVLRICGILLMGSRIIRVSEYNHGLGLDVHREFCSLSYLGNVECKYRGLKIAGAESQFRGGKEHFSPAQAALARAIAAVFGTSVLVVEIITATGAL